MLKCKICKGKDIKVQASGTADELMVETGMLIQQVYQSIRKQNPEAASGYRKQLLILLLSPDSPVWKTNGNLGGQP